MTITQTQIELAYTLARRLAGRYVRWAVTLDEDDLVQEAVMRVMASEERLAAATSIEAVMTTIMKSAMRETVRSWIWGGTAKITQRGSVQSLQGLSMFEDGESDSHGSVPYVVDDHSAMDVDLSDLTDRQREILELVQAGFEDQEIEQMLGMGRSTVYYERKRIAKKVKMAYA